MVPRLIAMLTHNDETVSDALELFRECAHLPCAFWGFKDVGLPKKEMQRLVAAMKGQGKTTFLEVVSLTEPECMDGAVLAVECGFDYLMGSVFYRSVYDYLQEQPVKFLPFGGQVSGHPSVLEGSIDEIVADGKRMEELGVDGFDLLAYRYVGDPVELARVFLSAVRVPVVLAGSIDSFERLDVVKGLSPWAFTIGSAFFEKKFVENGSFGDQMSTVLQYLQR
jgi:hypothetical protein